MSKKTPKNVPGAWYVDEECIACDACILAAEQHFKIEEDEEEPYAYVYKQPQTDADTALCQEAMDACPVEAIHKDGK